jgi:hypothetical protein
MHQKSQVLYFTGTEVQILPECIRNPWYSTCFTGTKVQIMPEISGFSEISSGYFAFYALKKETVA